MDKIDVTMFVLNRLWENAQFKGLTEHEFKSRAEELLYLYKVING